MITHLVLPERLKLPRTYGAAPTPDVSDISSVVVPHPTFVQVMRLMCCVLSAIGIFSYTSYKPFVLPLTPLKLYSVEVFVVGRGEGGGRGGGQEVVGLVVG
jgi:hypothetical protein